MSETVYYKGTLTPVEKLEGETLEQQCKRLLDNRELPSWCDSYQEILRDEFYQKYVVYNGILYDVDKENIDPESSVFKASVNDNGTINFEVRYYNGGCSFDEAIETALEENK